MTRKRSMGWSAIMLGVLVAALAPPGHAGLTDAFKKKVNDQASKTVESQTDKALGVATPAKDSSAATGAAGAGGSVASDATGAGGGAGGKVSSVSTRFDYVPGDSVMFLDDFRQDELGEFPAKWRLVEGTFDVAEMEGERWLRCTSADGHIRMKVPSSFPEFWTLEFDFYGVDLGAALALTVSAHSAAGGAVWEAMFPYSGKNLAFRCGQIFSNTPLEGSPVAGRHHVMFMARGPALKVYMDRERLASVPDVTGPGAPAELDFRLWAPTKPMIANVRFAEGCRPAKDMLAKGKLVTYGIRFATGSDVVLPESAPILRQVAAYMEGNTSVRIRITGHTDNVGSGASNLDLSRRRAGSVAAVLSSQFGIGADRFETDGKGDTQPVSSNARPEGRAMNRRVEFTKL